MKTALLTLALSMEVASIRLACLPVILPEPRSNCSIVSDITAIAIVLNLKPKFSNLFKKCLFFHKSLPCLVVDLKLPGTTCTLLTMNSREDDEKINLDKIKCVLPVLVCAACGNALSTEACG